MARDYTKIVAWQRAHELTLQIYEVTRDFPTHEMYGLVSQLRRAASSVAANIVEGSARNSKKDYLHFLNIAEASLRETEYFILLARDLGYCSDARYSQVTSLLNDTFAPLHGLQKAVRREADHIAGLIAFLTSTLAITISKCVALHTP